MTWCAASCGVGEATWRRWEAGRAPPVTIVRPIMAILGCAYADLFAAAGARP